MVLVCGCEQRLAVAFILKVVTALSAAPIATALSKARSAFWLVARHACHRHRQRARLLIGQLKKGNKGKPRARPK